MSPLWLLSFLHAALALNLASLSEAEVTDFAWEADAAVTTFPAEVADLEAAVAAKYNGPPTPSSLNIRKLEGTPEGVPPLSKVEVPPEVVKLEAAVLAKYSVASEAKQPPSLKVHNLEKSTAAAWPVEGVEVTAVQPSSLNVRKLDEPAAVHSAPVGEFAWESTAAASPEVAQQSSMNDAWPVAGVEVKPAQPSSLNVRKLDQPTAIYSAPVGEFPWEPTAAVALSAEVAQQSKLNVRKLAAPPAINSAPVGDFAWESTAAASPEATALQRSSLNVRRVQEVPQAEVPLTSPAKFTLKKPLNEVTPEDCEKNPSQPSLPDPFSPPAQEERVRKSKKTVMHDMPHYRNHGAAMYHVGAATRESASSRTAEQEAAAKERDEELAEKRAEVEDIFHLSKTDVQLEPESDTSVGTGRQLLRFVFLCAALLSIAGVAYHKYEVIYQLSAGKHGPQKFKAKNEDMGGFAEPPQSAQHASEGFITAMVASSCSSLSRRGGGQNRNSLPLPF